MYKNNFKRKGFVLWFTGLSCAGKSTIADEIFSYLEKKNIRVERLDGDAARENLTKDLGFSREDRDENIRRIGFVANLLARNGVAVVASFISPYKHQRKDLKNNIENFVEIFVDAPLEVCQARDTKGLYKKAISGEIKNFTGVSDPYEPPKAPDIHLKTGNLGIKDCVSQIIKFLKENKLIDE